MLLHVAFGNCILHLDVHIGKIVSFTLLSAHIECACLLSNKKAKLMDYVEIGVDAEDYYRIKDH